MAGEFDRLWDENPMAQAKQDCGAVFHAEEAGEGLVITGANAELAELEIPAEIGGRPVTAIGTLAFHGQTGLRRVYLPKGLIRIGRSAFQGCVNLSEIELPERMDGIGESAFQGCASLAAVKLPAGLTEIASRCFYGCSSLKRADVPEGVVRIGERAFAECRALGEIRLPDGLRRIEQMAFSGCVSLQPPRIPASVSAISANALPGSALTEGQLFLRPQAMLVRAMVKRHYALPEGTRGIAGWALAGNEALLSVDFGDALEAIGPFALANCGCLKQVELPDTVRRVEQGAFSGCQRMTRARLSPTLREIPGELFHHCRELEDVEMFPGIEAVGQRAFADCGALKALALPEGVHTVGERAFYRCASLERLELPRSLRILGKGAISGCPSLRMLVLRGPCDDAMLEVLSDARRATVIAPFQPPEAFPGLWRKRVCLGYALAGREGVAYDAEVARACLAWMRGHGSAFIAEALRDKALMHLLADEECLSLRDIQALLDRAAGPDRDEYYMTLLDYRNRRFGSAPAAGMSLWQ